MMLVRSFEFFVSLFFLGIATTVYGEEEESSSTTTLLLDFYRTDNDPCNICGADDGMLGNGDVVLPTGTAGILQEERTCADVQELALAGYFRPASCLLLPYELFGICGCISSQPPPVFPPEEQQTDIPSPTTPAPDITAPVPMTVATTTVFLLLEDLDSLLDPNNVDVFEQVCADFLLEELGDDGVSENLTCEIEDQRLVVSDVDPAEEDGMTSTTVVGVQLESEVAAETPPSVELAQVVNEVLSDGDGLTRLIEALQDASDAFNGISGGSLSSTAAPTPAPTTIVESVDPDEDDNEDDDDIFGIDRILFIAIAAGGGVFLLMLLLLCNSGRGTAGGPIRKSRPVRPEQPL